ncbi:MAG: AbrB/MazE/SpoVT family DNA-binding domain-containing protein [Rhizobiaceae bacterium]|nr:AbrB/MazE/SpoVT family DNA-binding domain-containing protein [Rhizobiaceae bacterium]
MRIAGTVTSKGQTTIPKLVRDELGLTEGSKIVWEVRDGKAQVEPRKTRRAIDLAGILSSSAVGLSKIEDMNEAIGHALAEDDERIQRQWHEKRG